MTKGSFPLKWLDFQSAELSFQYAGLLIFLLAGLIISLAFLTLAALRSNANPYPEKTRAYECGFDPLSRLDQPFSVRFALVAILFIVFDVEITLLFPWALTFSYQGLLGFVSIVSFLLVLALGFIYEWRSGALDWE